MNFKKINKENVLDNVLDDLSETCLRFVWQSYNE